MCEGTPTCVLGECDLFPPQLRRLKPVTKRPSHTRAACGTHLTRGRASTGWPGTHGFCGHTGEMSWLCLESTETLSRKSGPTNTVKLGGWALKLNRQTDWGRSHHHCKPKPHIHQRHGAAETKLRQRNQAGSVRRRGKAYCSGHEPRGRSPLLTAQFPIPVPVRCLWTFPPFSWMYQSPVIKPLIYLS